MICCGRRDGVGGGGGGVVCLCMRVVPCSLPE